MATDFVGWLQTDNCPFRKREKKFKCLHAQKQSARRCANVFYCTTISECHLNKPYQIAHIKIQMMTAVDFYNSHAHYEFLVK